MDEVAQLLVNNQAWAASMVDEDPNFFQRLTTQQKPDYLWIGCSDSRVPSTQLVGLLPGQMFVHRNVANLVVHSDLNCLAVLQYGVDVLRIRHIIVCGHYGCSGVYAALHSHSYGLVDNWLRHVQDVRNKYANLLDACANDDHRMARLCELNVIEQVVNMCQTTMVQTAWERGQGLSVHGWIYGLANGLLRDIGITITNPDHLAEQYACALKRIS